MKTSGRSEKEEITGDVLLTDQAPEEGKEDRKERSTHKKRTINPQEKNDQPTE